MRDACRALVRISRKADYTTFLADEDIQRMSERYFEILGEAASRLSEEFRDFHSEVHWSAWTGLRNIVAHQYHKVDYARLWELMTAAVPELLDYLAPLVPPED
ncbi:DUF86 domain-containing protein [candidate division KSB1 bacterium]|nr:DUF86 domain-containing protein [candidate division KSB1 bacterium]